MATVSDSLHQQRTHVASRCAARSNDSSFQTKHLFHFRVAGRSLFCSLSWQSTTHPLGVGAVADVARHELKEIYAPVDESGKERKPNLLNYPVIPWTSLNLDQFNFFPPIVRPLLSRVGPHWRSLHIVPLESGRGCPYGCEFCTVTGFFGDSIRFRTNESVVDELLTLKVRAKAEGGVISVFFVDDNFAISIKRTKSLLRDIIAAGAPDSLDRAD